MAWLLRFISGIYQGAEFPLAQDRSYLLGSAQDADLVIQGEHISARHARITCQRGEVFIEDLSSQSGVYIDGERITRAPLTANQRVLVGANIMILEDDAAEVEVVVPTRGSSTNDYHLFTGQLSGLLEEVPLPDFLQLLSAGRRSGVLELEGGRIGIRQGRICLAMLDDMPEMPARKALHRLLGKTRGQFIFLREGSENVSEAMLVNAANTHDMWAVPLENLLCSWLEHTDAMASLRAGGPEIAFDRAATLSRASYSGDSSDVTPPSKAHREVYAFILERPRAVGEVLDHGPLPDLELQQIVLDLLREGWIQITR